MKRQRYRRIPCKTFFEPHVFGQIAKAQATAKQQASAQKSGKTNDTKLVIALESSDGSHFFYSMMVSARLAVPVHGDRGALAVPCQILPSDFMYGERLGFWARQVDRKGGTFAGGAHDR